MAGLHRSPDMPYRRHQTSGACPVVAIHMLLGTHSRASMLKTLPPTTLTANTRDNTRTISTRTMSIKSDYREQAAMFDCTVRGAPRHTSTSPGSLPQYRAQALDSSAAPLECPGHKDTQDVEATSAKLFREECQECGEAQRPCQPVLQFSRPRTVHYVISDS